MDEFLKMYIRRAKSVEFLLNKTTNTNRRIQLSERLQEIYRAIYEVNKIKHKNN